MARIFFKRFLKSSFTGELLASSVVVVLLIGWKGIYLTSTFYCAIVWPQFFTIDGACDWLDLNSNFYPQPITSSVKKFRGKLMKNWKSVYFHNPFREKATFIDVVFIEISNPTGLFLPKTSNSKQQPSKSKQRLTLCLRVLHMRIHKWEPHGISLVRKTLI